MIIVIVKVSIYKLVIIYLIWKNIYGGYLHILKLAIEFYKLFTHFDINIKLMVSKYFLSVHKLIFFICWLFSLLYRRFLLWCNPSSLFLLLMSMLLGFMSPKNNYKQQCQLTFYLCFCLSPLQFCVLHWSV
jgi:hypothetical protein